METEYHAVRSGAGVVDRSHEGRMHAFGRDRADLLHRMSTNDLLNMQVGEARPTVFTTAIARMIDLVWVLNRAESLLLITSPGQGAALRRWLSGYIFFQDDVALKDAGAELAQLGVYGPKASEVVRAILPGAADLPIRRFIEQDGVLLLRARPLAGDGFTLIAPVQQVDAWREQVIAAGAVPIGEETYQALRVEAGYGYIGHEISEEYLPLEAGLWDAVSFSKGCYIGQEIIARMESRGRLAKTLVGLKARAPVAEGAKVHAGDQAVGVVSSAIISPELGPVALAFVRPDHAEPGMTVSLRSEGEVVEAVVSELPMC